MGIDTKDNLLTLNSSLWKKLSNTAFYTYIYLAQCEMTKSSLDVLILGASVYVCKHTWLCHQLPFRNTCVCSCVIKLFKETNKQVTLKQKYSELMKCFFPVVSLVLFCGVGSTGDGLLPQEWMFSLTNLALHWNHKAIQTYLSLYSVYFVLKSQTAINFRVLKLF